MNIKFTVDCSSFKTIREIQGYWKPQKYKEILEIMNYIDVASIAIDDLKDMCLMALTDNDAEKSAEIVLGYVFKDGLNSGQKANLSHKIMDERNGVGKRWQIDFNKHSSNTALT